jgi:RHS repeat-associated protein
VSKQEYTPWGEVRSGGIGQTTLNYTGQRKDGTGLLFYGARYYDPGLARFVSADSIVPGVADGTGGSAATLDYDEKVKLTPLTVDFHEPDFASMANEENAFALEKGFWFQLSDDDRQQAKWQWGPLNPQALNRYSYTLNNPVRYIDPTGHMAKGVDTTMGTGGPCGDCAVGATGGPGVVQAVVEGVSAVVGYVVGAVVGETTSHVVESRKKTPAQTSGKTRSEHPPAKRDVSNTKKKAYEKAKRAGKGNEPVNHHDGEHGPHYHPGDGKGKPLNHDHYYYPK